MAHDKEDVDEDEGKKAYCGLQTRVRLRELEEKRHVKYRDEKSGPCAGCGNMKQDHCARAEELDRKETILGRGKD